jgi:hypothetical protein
MYGLYQKVFSGPDGRAVLYDMMATHGMLTPHHVDTNKMLLKEGERLVVLRILSILKVDVKQLLERIEEHDADV